MRDSQRAKAYTAERAAFANFHQPDEDLKEIDQATDYVAQVMNCPRTHKALAAVSHWDSYQVRPGHGARSAMGGYSGLTLPRWSRSRPVILHEIAHMLDARMSSQYLPDDTFNPGMDRWPEDNYYRYDHGAHGWRFCMIYIELVRIHLGAKQAKKLKLSMKAKKVKHKKPRQLSPEHRAKLSAQGSKNLAAARERGLVNA